MIEYGRWTLLDRWEKGSPLTANRFNAVENRIVDLVDGVGLPSQVNNPIPAITKRISGPSESFNQSDLVVVRSLVAPGLPSIAILTVVVLEIRRRDTGEIGWFVPDAPVWSGILRPSLTNVRDLVSTHVGWFDGDLRYCLGAFSDSIDGYLVYRVRN